MALPTKREWLFKQGLTKAPTGRGRFSREAEGAYQKALRDGVKFADAAPAKAPRPKVTKGDSGVASRKRVAGDEGRDENYVPRRLTDNSGNVFPNPEFKEPKVTWEIPTPAQVRAAPIWKSPAGITKSNRDVCARCQYSIGWCGCVTPFAWHKDPDLGDILVPLTPAA